MKKVLIVVLLLGLILTACQKSTPTQSANEALQNGKPLRFVHYLRNHPIVRILMLGVADACKDMQVKCVDMGIDTADTMQLIQKMDEAISLGSSGIITGLDNPALYPGAEKAIKLGIPVTSVHVILSDTAVPGLLAWFSPDTTAYAVNVAKEMGAKMGGVGTVAITQGSFNDTENPVTASFTKTMHELYPKVVVLDPQEEGFDQVAAIAKAAAILQAHPEITAAFSTTGSGSTTWATALKEAGKKAGEVTVISMDYSKQNLDLVKDGWVYALVAQPLYEEAYQATVALVEKLQGKTVKFANILESPIIKLADLDKYYSYSDRSQQLQVP